MAHQSRPASRSPDSATSRARSAGAGAARPPLGEHAVEYLRRLSPRWRLCLGVEGNQDELSFIGEIQ